MNTTMIKKKLTILVLLLSLTRMAIAQTTLDTARSTAANFFRTYDSIPYLTFDAKFTYFSDTIYSDYSHDVLKGTYTMSGKKARYTLGTTEYLQNDSFYLAVYHDEQTIVVSGPKAASAGSFMPMREVSDSLLLAESSHYDFTVKTTTPDPETDNVGFITLTRKLNDTIAQFNRYTITFAISTNTITAIEYEFTEPGQELTSVDEPDDAQRLLKNTDRKRTLRIEFTNYRFGHFADADYSESLFIWEEDGQYRPVEKYKSYTVYNARN